LSLPIGVDPQYLPDLPTRSDGYPKGSHGCSPTVRPEEKALSNRQTGLTERTLNMCRILLRSCLQAMIASVLPFALKSREKTFRPPCWMTFFWISATVLRLKVDKWAAQHMRLWFNLRSKSLDRPDYRLAELIWSPSIQTPVEDFTHVGTVQPQFEVIPFLGHRVLDKHQPEAHHRRTGDNIPL
jgi:hypothetical protein